MSEVISVSLPAELMLFISENNLSPSKILQTKTKEIMEYTGSSEARIKKLQNLIEMYMERVREFEKFVEYKQLSKDFEAWKVGLS